MPQNAGIAYSASLPGTVADGASKVQLVDAYGALHVRAESVAWTEQGRYFRAGSAATPGTGIAQAITTSFSATAGPLVLVNGSATKKIVPHYIRFINTAAGASTTSARIAVAIDSANRYSSGGTDLTGFITNQNSALGPSSSVTVLRFGTVTLAAAGAGTRYAHSSALKVAAAPCWTLNDEVLLMFGGQSSTSSTLSTTGASTIAKNIGNVVLGGQNASLIVHLWNVANATTAPSWELDMAWWEI